MLCVYENMQMAEWACNWVLMRCQKLYNFIINLETVCLPGYLCIHLVKCHFLTWGKKRWWEFGNEMKTEKYDRHPGGMYQTNIDKVPLKICETYEPNQAKKKYVK